MKVSEIPSWKKVATRKTKRKGVTIKRTKQVIMSLRRFAMSCWNKDMLRGGWSLWNRGFGGMVEKPLS